MEKRVVTRSDCAAVAGLFFEAYIREPWLDAWNSQEQAAAYLNELWDNPHCRSFALAEAGRLHAVCLGIRRSWFSGAEFQIVEFFIDPEKQQSGLGSELMGFVKESLAAEGIQKIMLLTGRNFPAVKFYRKHGIMPEENMLWMSGCLE